MKHYTGRDCPYNRAREHWPAGLCAKCEEDENYFLFAPYVCVGVYAAPAISKAEWLTKELRRTA